MSDEQNTSKNIFSPDTEASLSTFQVKRYAKGHTIFREGDEGKSILLVLEGKLRVYRIDQTKKIDLAIVGPRQIVGEMAFLADQARSANVEALEDSEIIEIDTKRFEDHMKTEPYWFKIIIETLLTRIYGNNERIASGG